MDRTLIIFESKCQKIKPLLNRSEAKIGKLSPLTNWIRYVTDKRKNSELAATSPDCIWDNRKIRTDTDTFIITILYVSDYFSDGGFHFVLFDALHAPGRSVTR